MPIVEATMSAAAVRNDRPLAKRIEEAMSNAVTVAMEKGITDPQEIKAMMLAERDRVLAEARDETPERL